MNSVYQVLPPIFRAPGNKAKKFRDEVQLHVCFVNSGYNQLSRDEVQLQARFVNLLLPNYKMQVKNAPIIGSVSCYHHSAEYLWQRRYESNFRQETHTQLQGWILSQELHQKTSFVITEVLVLNETITCTLAHTTTSTSPQILGPSQLPH